MDSLTENVVRILQDTLKVSAIDIHSKLGTPYQWDSLRHISVILKLEEEFNTKIEPSSVAKLTSVVLIVQHLKKDGK